MGKTARQNFMSQKSIFRFKCLDQDDKPRGAKHLKEKELLPY
jgi:hypothetical protein